MRVLVKYIRLFIAMIGVLVPLSLYSQDGGAPHVEKRYNIFFRINSSQVDGDFKDNARTLEQMKKDIDSTLHIDGTLPDSLLILSTASPDGSVEYNNRLARKRAASTEKLLLELFPQFKDAHIKVEYVEEDWGGLMQVLKSHPDFPQREEMMKVIRDDNDPQSKELRLRRLKQGWRYLVNNYIYALRNSSITLTVVMTAENAEDEFVVERDLDTLSSVAFAYKPVLEQPFSEMKSPVSPEPKFRKTILAARTNLLIPAMNVGLEIPIGTNWSVGLDYYYPWFVSGENRWCGEMLGWFIDAKYWFPGKNNTWLPDSRLKGHAVGVYAGIGYYDYQKKTNGAQGEYLDFGIDYTYALPIADDKLRLEFNVGLGYIYTLYRPYYPSSDYEDLIKEPGIKYRSTNFIGPTRAGVSLVYPITVPTKKNPYTKLVEREQRKAERQNKRKGGDE
jgi:hypothetical protein